MDSLRKNLSEQSKRTNQLSPEITLSLDTNQLMSILHLCRLLFWGGGGVWVSVFASLRSTVWRTLHDLSCPYFLPDVIVK